MFLNGLNDDIQFQLLNTNNADFQHMVDKAIVIEIKIKERRRMARGRCHSLDSPLEAMLGPASRSLTSFFKSPQMNRPSVPVQVPHPQFPT
jgi:hypothetical protein